MGRQHRGRIFARNGHYCIQYYVGGKEHKHRLLDAQGNPIPVRWPSKTEREAHGGQTPAEVARAAADELIAPLRMKDRSATLRHIIADLKTTEERAEELERERREAGATLANLWQIFSAIHFPQMKADKPTSRRARQIRAYIRDFVEWCGQKGLFRITQIDQQVATQYFRQCKFPAVGANARLNALKMIFKHIAEKGGIVLPDGRNPFASVEPRKTTNHRKQALTREQLRALFAAAGTNEELRAFLMCGYYCGLRRADCVSLRWNEIQDGVIVKAQAKLRNRMSEDKATVRVGVPEPLAGQLAKLPRQTDGHVFPSIAGMGNRRLGDTIRDVFAAAGMVNERKNDDGSTIVDFGFHSLRHSYISDCIAAGIPLAIVQKQAGHNSAEMTMHYLHIQDEQARQYAALMPII